MRPSSVIAVSLIVLHLLFSAVYGTRIGKFGIKSAKTLHVNLKINNEKVHVLKQDDIKRVEQSLGKNRKQVTSTSMSTAAQMPIQEDLEKGLNNDMLKSGLNEVKHRHASLSPSTLSTDNNGKEEKKQKMRAKDEDLMDMIEMDYSPAMKKPPIHN